MADGFAADFAGTFKAALMLGTVALAIERSLTLLTAPLTPTG